MILLGLSDLRMSTLADKGSALQKFARSTRNCRRQLLVKLLVGDTWEAVDLKTTPYPPCCVYLERLDAVTDAKLRLPGAPVKLHTWQQILDGIEKASAAGVTAAEKAAEEKGKVERLVAEAPGTLVQDAARIDALSPREVATSDAVTKTPPMSHSFAVWALALLFPTTDSLISLSPTLHPSNESGVGLFSRKCPRQMCSERQVAGDEFAGVLPPHEAPRGPANEEIARPRRVPVFMACVTTLELGLFLFTLVVNGGVETPEDNAMIGPRWETLYLCGGLQLRQGQSWRLLTAVYLHAGLLHLLPNVVIQWFIGGAVEIAWGTRWTALLYLLSGFGGNLLTATLSSPRQLSVQISARLG
ncbi:unnamed protein product, partial [Polarella glacialis]